MTFEEWMQKNRYRESTIHQTQSDLRRAGVAGGLRDPNVISALRRYHTYAVEHDITDDFRSIAEQAGVGSVKRLPKAKQDRKLAARGFDDHDWDTLRREVQNATDPCDQVLWIMTTTALRVGDVLRVDRKTLTELVNDPDPIIHLEEKGGRMRLVPIGIPEPWIALARGVDATRAPTVAQYVCRGAVGDVRGSCAYQRVLRRLRTLQRKLELSGRVNSHRIRRTIAVRTLEATGDIVAAQQMLGHLSMQSTLKYVDEANLRKTKRLQRKIAGLE